jgi:hypothetical protein
MARVTRSSTKHHDKKTESTLPTSPGADSTSSLSSLSSLSDAAELERSFGSSEAEPSDQAEPSSSPSPSNGEVTPSSSSFSKKGERRPGRQGSDSASPSNSKKRKVNHDLVVPELPYGWVPKNPELYAFLLDANALPKDYLAIAPPKDYKYIDSKGYLKPIRHREVARDPPTKALHPVVRRHAAIGHRSEALNRYYEDMPHVQKLPIAGCIFHESMAYVDERPCRKPKFRSCFQDHLLITYHGEQEENFHARPSIQLPVPDHIKAILVDDWENVTKNQQLVPLPAAHPVNAILDEYLAYEMPKRDAGSASADLLEEVVAGMKEYFEKCLGRILLYRYVEFCCCTFYAYILYRFERNQFQEVRELWTAGKDEWEGKTAGDTYGAEHLCRLIGKYLYICFGESFLTFIQSLFQNLLPRQTWISNQLIGSARNFSSLLTS